MHAAALAIVLATPPVATTPNLPRQPEDSATQDAALLLAGSALTLGAATAFGHQLIEARREDEAAAFADPCGELLCDFRILPPPGQPFFGTMWGVTSAASVVMAGAGGDRLARAWRRPGSTAAAWATGSVLLAGGITGATFGIIESQRRCLPDEIPDSEPDDLGACWSTRQTHGLTAFALGGLGLSAGSAAFGWAIRTSQDSTATLSASITDSTATLALRGRW